MSYNTILFKETEPVRFIQARMLIKGEMQLVDWPKYTPTAAGDTLRTTRLTGGIGLRKAAALLDLTASDLSGVETGRLIFRDADDFAHAVALLGAQ